MYMLNIYACQAGTAAPLDPDPLGRLRFRSEASGIWAFVSRRTPPPIVDTETHRRSEHSVMPSVARSRPPVRASGGPLSTNTCDERGRQAIDAATKTDGDDRHRAVHYTHGGNAWRQPCTLRPRGAVSRHVSYSRRSSPPVHPVPPHPPRARSGNSLYVANSSCPSCGAPASV